MMWTRPSSIQSFRRLLSTLQVHVSERRKHYTLFLSIILVITLMTFPDSSSSPSPPPSSFPSSCSLLPPSSSSHPNPNHPAQSLQARILQRAGDFPAASQLADDARSMDLADRFLNSESVQHMLRADQVRRRQRGAWL